MKEADASNFFRRRSRRGAKSQDEINSEFKLGLFVTVWNEVWPDQVIYVGVVLVGICTLLHKYTFWQQMDCHSNFLTVISSFYAKMKFIMLHPTLY